MTCSGSFKIDNPTAANMAKLEAALYYLQQSEMGRQLLMEAASKGVTIQFSNPVNYNNGYSAPTHKIIWNPNQGVAVQDSNGNFIGAQSSALSLAHEIAHAIDPMQAEQTSVPNAQYDNASEAEAVIFTDTIAKELGEIQRLNYKGDHAIVQNVTTHTTEGQNGSQVWTQVGQNGTVENGPAYASGTKTAPQFGTVDAYKNVWEFGAGHCDDRPAPGTGSPEPGSTSPAPITDLGTYLDNLPVSGSVQQPDDPEPPIEDGPGTPIDSPPIVTPPEGPIDWVPIGENEDGQPIYGSVGATPVDSGGGDSGGGGGGGGGAVNPLVPIEEDGDSIAPTESAANGKIAVFALEGGSILSFAARKQLISDGTMLTMAVAGTDDAAFALPTDLIAIDPPVLVDGAALLADLVIIGVHHDMHHAMVR